MQNSEQWNLDFYLMDLADEIARHAFNTGRYPEINYITGNADKDTPTETNQDGSLNVYIPQGINPQQFQQALDEYIKKNGSVLMYQESQCNVQVVQCPSTKEDAQKEIQAFNAAQHGTAYYRLINGPNNSLYIMKCEAQTPEIKEQIQQQFENQNGYYYSQTNTYTPNSYESNSKESKYITALKMFYFTGIMPQRLPQPDQDDEEQQKLYDVCRFLSSYALQVHYNFCYNIMLNKFKNKQADLDDDEFKKCGIEIYDLYDRSVSQISQQSLLPVPVSPVPIGPEGIYDPGSGLTSTSFDQNGNPIYQQPPVTVTNPTVPVKINQYYIPEPVIISENINSQNNMNNANNINLQQEEEFEDFGTIQIQQISGNSADNAQFKVTCKDKNGQEYCSDFDTNFPLKTVACDLTNNLLGMPGGGYNFWQFYDSGSKTFVDMNAFLYDLKDRTISVKRKKRLAKIGNQNNNISPYDRNANNNDAKFTLTKEDFKKNINNNGVINYI